MITATPIITIMSTTTVTMIMRITSMTTSTTIYVPPTCMCWLTH